MTRDLARVRHGGAFSEVERDAAAGIVAAVRRDGDAAVLRAVRRFDRPRAAMRELVADAVDLRRAARGCPRDVRAAVGIAYSRIRAFHERQRPREIPTGTRTGTFGWSQRRSIALARSFRAACRPTPPPC